MRGRKGEKAPFSPALLLLILALLVPLTLAQTPELSSRAFDLARQLRCPVCTAESVADSGSEVSVEMRVQIQQLLEEGRSDAQVLAYFQERYGDWILLEPPKRGLHLLVWLLPLGAALVGVLTLTLVFRRWLRRSQTPLDASEGDLSRVREVMREN